MDTPRADRNLQVKTASPEELTDIVEIAIRLDDAFTLVNEALALDPAAQELRAALEKVAVRGVCRLVRDAVRR